MSSAKALVLSGQRSVLLNIHGMSFMLKSHVQVHFHECTSDFRGQLALASEARARRGAPRAVEALGGVGEAEVRKTKVVSQGSVVGEVRPPSLDTRPRKFPDLQLAPLNFDTRTSGPLLFWTVSRH